MDAARRSNGWVKVAAFAVLLLPACGYRLVPTDRAAHLALRTAGPVHPDVVPAVAHALRTRLRDEGVRLSSGATARELDVVMLDSAEVAALPSENEDGRFVPAVWDARLFARVTLRRDDGTTTDLGVIEAAGQERTADDAPLDDRAQSAAVETAARVLAERIVAAALAAW